MNNQNPESRFDGFVSYCSAEAPVVEAIHAHLESSLQVRLWIDRWDIEAGSPWQEQLERALLAVPVVFVFVGESGLGPWQTEECRVAIAARVRSGSAVRVVPVLLSGVSQQTIGGLPPFLTRHSWIALGDDLDDADLARFRAAIAGRSPRDALKSTTGTRDRLSPSFPQQQMLDIARPRIRAVLGWIESVQNDDFGLPSDRAGSYSCVWTSAGLLWSALAAGASFSDRLWMDRVIGWVAGQLNDDGGAPIVVKDDPSIVDATAQFVLAAVPREQPHESRLLVEIASAVDWLVRSQNPTGGWAWRPTGSVDLRPYTASTALAVAALVSALDAGVVPRPDIVSSSIDGGTRWLRETKNADQGWGSYSGDVSRPAIAGLVAYLLAEHDAELFSGTADFLRITQDGGDGGWPTVIDRPAHTVTRIGNSYGLAGLATLGGDEDEQRLQRALDALLSSFRANRFVYGDSVVEAWPTRDGLLALSALARLCEQ